MTTAVALDCEMAELAGGCDAVAQICAVSDLQQFLSDDPVTLFKSYVRPIGHIVDYRTPHSGLRPADLVDAPALTNVVSRVRALLRGRLVVGHSVRTDLRLLGISHPEECIRDTSELPKFLDKGCYRRKLKELAWEFLHRRIQQGSHDPEQDACACMSLYLAHWNLPGAAPVPPVRCRHCQQAGHRANNCPIATCFRCGLRGHMQSGCTRSAAHVDTYDDYYAMLQRAGYNDPAEDGDDDHFYGPNGEGADSYGYWSDEGCWRSHG